MRRGTLVFLVINLVVIGFLINAFSTLISLLFDDGAADAIRRAEIPAPGSDLIENRTQLIPKIIHQTYINNSIPEQWKDGQQSCIHLHDDYEYKVAVARDAEAQARRLTRRRSSGPTTFQENSSQPSTLGSSRPSTTTPSLYSAPMPFATSCSPSTAGYISTWTMAAIDA